MKIMFKGNLQKKKKNDENDACKMQAVQRKN